MHKVRSVEGVMLTFPNEEAALGYCEAKNLDPASVIFIDTSPAFQDLKNALRLRIDLEANSTYEVYVPSAGLLKEYQQAEDDAKAWSANKQIAVPATVVVWASAKQWTVQQAVDDILTAAARLRGLLTMIRKTRLDGKEAVSRATTCDEAQAAADAAIAVLKGLR